MPRILWQDRHGYAQTLDLGCELTWSAKAKDFDVEDASVESPTQVYNDLLQTTDCQIVGDLQQSDLGGART